VGVGQPRESQTRAGLWTEGTIEMRTILSDGKPPKRYNRLRPLVLYTWLLLVSSGCAIFGPPADETRENISLEEAERLVSFTPCLPSYLPTEVDPTPHVKYHAELGDPADADIRVAYYLSGSQEPAVEVYQKRFRVLDGYLDSEDHHEVSLRELLAWVVGWSRVDETRQQLTTHVTPYQDDSQRWLFEIVEPTSLRANMVEWGNASMHYRVYTRLTIEEAKQIARSLSDCLLKPAATPPSQ